MRKLSLFLYKKSKLSVALILTGLMIAYASLIMSTKSSCFKDDISEDMRVLGLNFGYEYNDVISLFNSLSPKGKDCYYAFMAVWDSVFPLLYASMYIIWLSLIYRYPGKNKRVFLSLNLYPLIPMIVDWAENYWELKLLSEFINTNDLSVNNVKAGSLITQIKWIFSSINYIIILTGLIRLIKIKIILKNSVK